MGTLVQRLYGFNEIRREADSTLVNWTIDASVTPADLKCT